MLIYIPFVHYSFPRDVPKVLVDLPDNIEQNMLISVLFPALELPINPILIMFLGVYFNFVSNSKLDVFTSVSYKEIDYLNKRLLIYMFDYL